MLKVFTTEIQILCNGTEAAGLIKYNYIIVYTFILSEYGWSIGANQSQFFGWKKRPELLLGSKPADNSGHGMDTPRKASSKWTTKHCNCERILLVFMYMATTESDSLEICRIASSCFILVFKATSLFFFGFLCLLHSRWPWQKVCDSNIPIGCLLNSLSHTALWSLSKYAAMSYVKALKTF